MKALILVVAALLCGCESSPIWYASNPDKQTVTIDGYDVNVVPHGAGKFDAWGGDDGSSTSTPQLKARQIRAVELVSKCKVTAAEFIPSSWILQTLVSCS